MKTRQLPADDVKRGCDDILAVRFILLALADADDRPEPMVVRWLSDRLSDAVGMIEGEAA